MKRDKTAKGYSVLCCMDPNCSDHECAGRELARRYHAEGAQDTEKQAPSPFLFGLVTVMRLLPLVFVATALVAFFIFDVLKGTP